MGVAGEDSSRALRAPDFRAFVIARSPQLLRSAYLLTGDRSSAEDLVQNALLKTYLAWDRVTSANDPFAYTQRILYTTSHRLHRRRRVTEEFGLLPDLADPDSGRSVEDSDELGAALSALPRKQRAVLILRYYEDLSIERVAEVMGCSPGTVKSQTFKALAKLRGSPTLSSVLDAPNTRKP